MKKLIQRVATSGVLVIVASGMFVTAAEAGVKLHNHSDTVVRGRSR